MNSLKKSTTRALVLSALMAGCGAAQAAAPANLLFNGSFELGSTETTGFSPLGTGSTAMTGWTVVGDNLNWFHAAYSVPGDPNYLAASNGVKFLDLTGLTAGCTPCGGVEQVIATNVGDKYTLSFDLGSSSGFAIPAAITATLQIVVGGIVTETFTSTASGVNNWETFSKSFTASAASTTVRVVGSFAQMDYVGLDNVAVTAAVPEPGTWAMMLAGMAAVGSVASRRRAQR